MQFPTQAIKGYRIADEGKIYLFTGSKSTGGFCVTRQGLLLPSKLGHILAETPELLHAETDYLLTYPEENSFTVQEEAKFLKAHSESKNAIEIAAFVDGRIAGTAGIDPIDDKEKIRHRADFGIAIEKAYWGRGIGKALTLACIECAKQAGYLQIELEVVAENASAVRLYESVGFQEYGRNPRGFRARSGWQTLVLMRLELDS